jgi:hypothetical protein
MLSAVAVDSRASQMPSAAGSAALAKKTLPSFSAYHGGLDRRHWRQRCHSTVRWTDRGRRQNGVRWYQLLQPLCQYIPPE